MKKFLSLLLVCLMVVPFGMLAGVSVSAADDVLYVKDNATGDGSSATNALGSMEAAYDKAIASGKDTTIVLVGDVHFNIEDTYGFYPADHAGKITITGKHGGVDGGKLFIAAGDQQNWVLGGALEFKDVELNTWSVDPAVDKPNIVFRAHFHPITFGDGFVTGAGLSIYVVGGVANAKPFGSPDHDGSTPIVDTYKYNADENTYTGDINITIKSGTFKEIGIVSRGVINTDAKVIGTANFTISGGTVEKVAAFRNTGSAMSGDINIYLNGGSITNFLCHNHNSAGATNGVAADSKFTVVITKNFNIAESFNNPPSGGFYQGIAGSTLTEADAATVLANDLFGDYRFFAEESVFDEVVSSQKVFLDSFNTFNKVDDGTGLDISAKTATPTQSDVEMPEPPVVEPESSESTPVESNPVESEPADSKPVETEKEDDETTKAPSSTNKPSTSTQKTDSSTKAPAATEEEGGFPVWIIAVIAGVAVAAVVVVVIIVKKKKAE